MLLQHGEQCADQFPSSHRTEQRGGGIAQHGMSDRHPSRANAGRDEALILEVHHVDAGRERPDDLDRQVVDDHQRVDDGSLAFVEIVHAQTEQGRQVLVDVRPRIPPVEARAQHQCVASSGMAEQFTDGQWEPVGRGLDPDRARRVERSAEHRLGETRRLELRQALQIQSGARRPSDGGDRLGPRLSRARRVDESGPALRPSLSQRVQRPGVQEMGIVDDDDRGRAGRQRADRFDGPGRQCRADRHARIADEVADRRERMRGHGGGPCRPEARRSHRVRAQGRAR